MAANDKHIRHIMLYEFRKNNNASVATKNICAVYENAVSVWTVRRWFEKFRSGDFSLDDEPGRGRKTELDIDALKELVESDPRQTTREMAETLGTSHTTIRTHLERLGKVHKFGFRTDFRNKTWSNG
jgi:histone-lysine N-methyltransferase SETMAR